MFNTGNNNTQGSSFGRSNDGLHNGLIHNLNQLIDERIKMFFQPSFNQRNRSGLFNQGSFNNTNQTTTKRDCFCIPNQRNINSGFFGQSQNRNSFDFNSNSFGANTNEELNKPSLFNGNQKFFGQNKQNNTNDQNPFSKNDNKNPSPLFGSPFSFKDNSSNIYNHQEGDIENGFKTINKCSFTIDKEKEVWDYISKLELKIFKLDDENKDLILKMDNLVKIMKGDKETNEKDSFKDSQDDFIILSEHSNKKEKSISKKTKIKCIRYQQLYKEELFKLPSFNTREQDMVGIKHDLYRPNKSLTELIKLLKDQNNIINKDFDWEYGNLSEYFKYLSDQEHLINKAMDYIKEINQISRTRGVFGLVGMPGIYSNLDPLLVLDIYDNAKHCLSELLLLNNEFKAFLEETLVKE